MVKVNISSPLGEEEGPDVIIGTADCSPAIHEINEVSPQHVSMAEKQFVARIRRLVAVRSMRHRSL